MSTDAETPDPKRDERHGLAGELAALLDALQALYTQISTKLWHRRMEPPPPSALAGDSADITGALSGHIERTAAEAASGAIDNPPEKPTEHPVKSVPAGGKKRPEPGMRLFSGFTRHLRRRGRGAGQRHLGEKLRADTLRHINDALRLARRGDAQGAKLRTELAESAMRTASNYLPEEEYLAFKQELEERLKGIVGDRR